jgi:polyphenol oxidase
VLAFTDERGRVAVAFTDRWGGVSSPPYAELSLAVPAQPADGCSVTALRAEVTENRTRLSRAVTGGEHGDRLRTMRQVHGTEVAYVGPAHDPDGAADPEADALLTDRPGVVVAARAADCVPVLIGDAEAGVVAAVHAGRNGLVSGVVPRAVAALRERGARRLTAWIGPHVCGRCYEVPSALRDQVAGAVPGTGSETSWGTPALDLGAGVRRQLEGAAGRELRVEVVAFEPCTVEDERFYSYRRQGASAGRHAGLAWLRS